MNNIKKNRTFTAVPKFGGLRIHGSLKSSFQDYPLVTVVTVVFNGADKLRSCIDSVIQQDYTNLEYIIVDGGSNDGTVEIIKEYDDKIDYWVSEPDSGIYDAWNKAILLSKGDWISFLGSDDAYHTDAISSYIEVIRKDQSINYISSKVNLTTPSKQKIIGKPYNDVEILDGMYIAHVGSLHSRALLLNGGLFSTDYAIAGDYDFFLRNRLHIHPAHMNKVTAIMGCKGLSNSVMIYFDVYKVKRKHRTSVKSILIYYLFRDILIFSILKIKNYILIHVLKKCRSAF